MKYIFSSFFIFYVCCSSTFAQPADPKAYLQMLYESKGGYTIPSDDAETIMESGGNPQYGEIPYDSAAHILDDMHLTRQDVFYDLGSGVGKLVLQVYLTTPVKRSVGVELSKTRFEIAENCHKQAIQDDHITVGRELVFLNQNLNALPLSDATVCFISGITFPLQLVKSIMDKLSTLEHKVKVISVLPLPEHKHFNLIKTYNLPMSWAPEGVDVCLYNVTPGGANSDTSSKSHKRKRGKKRLIQQEDD